MTPTLQIAQGEGRRIDICFAGSPSDRRVASSHLDFSLGLKEQDSLRWYWEDYLEHPDRRTRRLAADVEQQLQRLGERLFQRVFSGGETQQIWSDVAPRLSETRIEIVVSGESAPIPWELMRDPLTGATLSTKSHSFVRRLSITADRDDSEAGEQAHEGPLRILLVSCQPPGAADPPFRSAARVLVSRLSSQPRSSLVLDVLRPPTFGQLTSILLEAEALGEPYHTLHFDGHAIAADIKAEGIPPELPQGAGRLPCTNTLPGLHGYMVFDYPTREQTVQLVDGVSMGELLTESRVPLLVLNACQPSRTKEAATTAGSNARKTTALAFESLARDVQTQGVHGVVQLPYHLGPVASAHWLEQIYVALAEGASISEAATAARHRIQQDERLQISYGPVRREDWPAAVVHECRPLALVRIPPPKPLPPDEEEEPLPAEAKAIPAEQPGGELLDPALPPRPAVGFLGRDDTILAIERALSAKPLVVLHGEAGAGKTTTAAEFARWYAATGGVEGPVLYTSFEQHSPLSSLLDQLEAVFRRSMEAVGLRWQSMSHEERRQAALDVLEQIPVLWIWDSADDLGGSGALPEWSEQERKELAEFLKQAAETQAKFLLTSRSPDNKWLGAPAVHIQLGPLPLWEGLQLIRGLVEQQGCWPPDIDSWRPLLDFAAGNPLAIQALVTECLRRGLRSQGQFEEFVRQAAAAPAFAGANEAPVAQPASVTAALRCVLREAFDEEERSLLAMLHLFRGTVHVELLEKMGAQTEVWTPKAATPTAARRPVRPFPAVAPTPVLDRAVSYGLLRRTGGGAYAIHPALNPACRQIFAEQFPAAKKAGVWDQMADRAAAVAAGARAHPDESAAEASAPRGPASAVVGALAGLGEHGSLSFGQLPPEMGPAQRANFAYVRALSRFGSERFGRVRKDASTAAVVELSAQEPNLRHACRLAGDQEWWEPAAGIAEGLGTLYEAEGRLGEWEGMVEGLWALCAEGEGAPAKTGRERLWRTVTEQSVKIARQRQRLPRAEQLQRLCVDWDRRQAEPLLGAAPETPDSAKAEKVRTLAESLFGLSEILREEGTPAVPIEEEAIVLRERLGEKQQASIWAFELGAVYTETPSVRDLAQAERWLKRSLELIRDDEPDAKAQCLAALGRVAWERFNESRKANALEPELRRHLNTARQYYQLALEHDQPGDWGKLASHNQQLGHVSYALGDIDRALPHYRESIRCDELHGNVFGAAHTRFNLAIALRDVDRLAEARKFARASREEFEALGASAKGMLERCEKLVANIEERLQEKRRERGVSHYK